MFKVNANQNSIIGTYVAITSVTLIISNAVLLPKLKQKLSDYQILLISIIIMIISMLLIASLNLYPSMVTMCVSAIFLSISLLVIPASNAIVTKYLHKNEQGIGFGVIYAARGCTYAIAPFSFGYLYNVFKKKRMEGMIYVIAAFLVLGAIPIIVFPLRRVLNDPNTRNRKYSFTHTRLNSDNASDMLNDNSFDNNSNNNNDNQIENTNSNINDKFDNDYSHEDDQNL